MVCGRSELGVGAVTLTIARGLLLDIGAESSLEINASLVGDAEENPQDVR